MLANQRATHLLLLAAAILQIVWGLVPSASKFVIDEIPIELYIAIRWTISGGIFALYLYVTRSWVKVSARTLVAVSALGIFGYGFASLGTLYGLKIGGVTNFALMGALSPAITSVIAIAILKERPSPLFLIALPMSVLGLALLLVGKYQVSSLSVASASAICAFIGYILEAFVFVFSKKFKSKMSVVQYLAISQLAAALFMWILQIAAFHQFEKIYNLSLLGIGAAAFVSIVACVLCYAILYWLLKYIDGHRLALFDGFHTISATIFGYFVFHEQMKPLMLVGGALILIGLVAGNLPEKNSEEIPEQRTSKLP